MTLTLLRRILNNPRGGVRVCRGTLWVAWPQPLHKRLGGGSEGWSVWDTESGCGAVWAILSGAGGVKPWRDPAALRSVGT